MEPVTMLLAAISALSSAVIFLYLQSLANHKACLQDKKECDAKYVELLAKVVSIETERRVYDEVERRVASMIRPSANP